MEVFIIAVHSELVLRRVAQFDGVAAPSPAVTFSGYANVQNVVLLSCLDLRVSTIDLGMNGFERARLGAFPAGWFEPQSAVETLVEETIPIGIVSFTSKWRSLLITIFESNDTIRLVLGTFSAKASNPAQESTAISLHVGGMRGEFSSLVAVGDGDVLHVVEAASFALIDYLPLGSYYDRPTP